MVGGLGKVRRARRTRGVAPLWPQPVRLPRRHVGPLPRFRW
jgi:hypothetical protein